MPEPMRPPMMNRSPRLALAWDRYLEAAIAWAAAQTVTLLLGSWSDVPTETKHIEMLCAKAVLEWELANTPPLPPSADYDDETIAELLGTAQI